MPKIRPYNQAQKEKQETQEILNAIVEELRLWKFSNRYTNYEAAEKLGISHTTWSDWICKGRIQTCQFGKLYVALRRVGLNLELQGGKAALLHAAGKKVI